MDHYIFSHEVGQIQKNNSSTAKIRGWVSCATNSGETSPTFFHANAIFSVFIDRIRNQFLKNKILIMICMIWQQT